jgi:hypothetical protein
VNIPNPFKRAPLNNVTSLPCAHNHLSEDPHPVWRYAQHIGWFKLDELSGEFLFHAEGPAARKPFDGKPTEYSLVVNGRWAYSWCLADMPQASVDSIPGSKEPKAAHTGFGAHWHQYCDPHVLRHMRVYPKGDPRHLNSGRSVLGNKQDDIPSGKAPIR